MFQYYTRVFKNPNFYFRRYYIQSSFKLFISWLHLRHFQRNNRVFEYTHFRSFQQFNISGLVSGVPRLIYTFIQVVSVILWHFIGVWDSHALPTNVPPKNSCDKRYVKIISWHRWKSKFVLVFIVINILFFSASL